MNTVSYYPVYRAYALRTSPRKLYRTLRADCNQKLRQSGRTSEWACSEFVLLRNSATSDLLTYESICASHAILSIHPACVCLKCVNKGLPARGVFGRVRTFSGNRPATTSRKSCLSKNKGKGGSASRKFTTRKSKKGWRTSTGQPVTPAFSCSNMADQCGNESDACALGSSGCGRAAGSSLHSRARSLRFRRGPTSGPSQRGYAGAVGSFPNRPCIRRFSPGTTEGRSQR